MRPRRQSIFKSLDLAHHLLFAGGFHPLKPEARRNLARAILNNVRQQRGVKS